MKTTEISTRDKILDAANRLFYQEGIRAVSVDAIAERAKVTKRTIYYHFRSKDELVADYLRAQDQPSMTAFKQWFDTADGTVADKTATIFYQAAENARHPRWRGCGFLRTVAELANMPGHPAVAAGAAHKKNFEAWLSNRFSAAGLTRPDHLAQSIAIMMDGAFATMLTHKEPHYAITAGDAAKQLISAQLTAEGLN